MDKNFKLGGKVISVSFEKYAVRLKANYVLIKILKKKELAVLVVLIKESYSDLYGKAFNISNKSLIVEIAAHIYAYKISLFFRKFFSLGFVRKFSYHVCKIDCGEKGHDTNRWVWDTLSFTSGLFVAKRQ